MTIAEYVFLVVHGSAAPPHDYGAAAVIDGKTLKITPFRSANIPPPMALHEIAVQQNIYDAAFSADNSTIAVLHQGGIAIYSWDITSTYSSPPSFTGRLTYLQNILEEEHPQQICFSANREILTLHYSESRECMILRRYDFSKDTDRIEEKDLEVPYRSSTSLIFSFSQDGSTYPFAQTAAGVLQCLTPSLKQDVLTDINFPKFLPWVELVPHGNTSVAFGMSENGQLYANNRLLVKNCTSFLVTPQHLIFTTTTHLLKFVHITDVEGWPPFTNIERY